MRLSAGYHPLMSDGLDQRPDGLGVLVGASQRLRRLADMHRSAERLASGRF
jgi:hypothetical protein